jgi:hypothetical protein
MSVQLNEKAITLLSKTTVSLAATGATTLYTVPNGYTCVLESVFVVAGADASTSALTVGKSTALTDFLPTQTLTSVNAALDTVKLCPVPLATPALAQKQYVGGDIIQVNVTTGSGGATNTFYLFGFLAAV